MIIKLSNRDYIWSYIGVVLSLLANVILTPFVLFYLDEDSFGIWGVFVSLGAITTLFDFGFSTTFARNINYCWSGASSLKKRGAMSTEGKINYYLFKKTMKACQIVFFIIAAFALGILAIIGTIYIRYISRNITNIIPIVAWEIYAIGIVMNLYFGYYAAFLRGVGDIADANKAVVIAKSIQLMLTITLLRVGAGLIGTGIAYLVYGACYYQLARKYFYKYKNIGKCIEQVTEKIPINELREVFDIVWYNAWREGIVSLSNYLANQACTVICSLYLSLNETGTYSLAVQLATAISQISTVMYGVNQPILQSAYIQNDKKALKRTMAFIIFTYVMLNLGGLLLVIIVGLPILKVIKPEIIISWGVMLGVGVYQFMLKFRNCYTSYFSCTNRIPYVKSFLISSILCIVLSIFNLTILGRKIEGLIIAQIVSQGIYNFWAWAYRANKEIGLSMYETMKLGFEETKKIITVYCGR